MKRWRVVYVTGLYDEGIEVARCWTERGAWREADRMSVPIPLAFAPTRVGWPEVRRTNDSRTTGAVLDDEYARLMREQHPTWPDHPNCPGGET